MSQAEVLTKPPMCLKLWKAGCSTVVTVPVTWRRAFTFLKNGLMVEATLEKDNQGRIMFVFRKIEETTENES